MKEELLRELTPQVSRNCNLSDAAYWGHYSVCGLLMRLRELYRFEHRIEHGGRIDREDIMQWIGRRESLWAEMAGEGYSPIRVSGAEYGPFEAGPINRVLAGRGLIYGAGYGVYMKPVFFLANLDGAESSDGCDIYLAGREYARDLSIHPAMLQGRTIYARSDAARVLIFEKFEEFKARGKRGPLWEAFSSYGVTPASGHGEIGAVCEAELRTFIHHEIGEARESERLGPAWAELLSTVSSRKGAAFVRAVKDALADTTDGGTAEHIVSTNNPGSLFFHTAFLSGYLRRLLRPLREATELFAIDRDWGVVESARKLCHRENSDVAEALLGIYRREKEDPAALDREVEGVLSRKCPEAEGNGNKRSA